MGDEVVVEMMPADFILWRCLHGGPLTRDNLERCEPNPQVDWAGVRSRNVPLLRALTEAYGACAVVAREGDRIVGTLRFYPRAKLSFDASAAYNPYYDSLSSLRLSGTVGAKAEGNFLTVNWFTSRNSWTTGIDPALIALYSRDQVGAFAGVRLPRLALDLEAEADYNVEEKKLLYTGARLTYHYQCVDFLVDVRSYYYRDPPDVQVRFSLGLGAIGKTLDFLGGFGF